MNREDRRYFESEEFQDILQRWESMLQRRQMGYMDAEELANLADYYIMVANDDAAAEEVINFATTLHPDAVEVSIFMARRALRECNLDLAEELCAKIETDDYREASLLRTEIMVCRSESANALDYVLTVADTEISEDLDFFLYDAAYIFVEHGDLDSAQMLAHRLEDVAPDWYSTWELLADVYIGEELFEQALVYIEKMLDVEAFEVETWNWSAEACCGIGDMERAMESVEYAIAIEPDNMRTLQLKAWLLAAENQPAEAHDLYAQLQERQPDNGENWLYDAQPLIDIDQPQLALTAAQRAIEIFQANGDTANMAYAHEMTAQALCVLDRCDEAMEQLEIAGHYVHNDGERAELELMRARVMLQTKQPKCAQQYVERAQKADTSQTAENLYRGAALFYEFYYDDLALDMFRKTLTMFSDDVQQANCHAYIAACLINTGKKEEALSHLLTAVRMKADILQELFEELFPAGVRPEEFPDYLFHDIHGRWPADGECC